jgi:N-formylglutamate amidohydrolase
MQMTDYTPGPAVAQVVLHAPHSSRVVPPDIRSSLCLDDAALDAELLRMTDAFTDELFRVSIRGVAEVVHPVSRLVLDPERFREDEREPMSSRGMGAIYMRTAHGQPLRSSLDDLQRQRLLQRWYDPHHQRLTSAADAALINHGRCLIVDCHSFPSTPLPCDMNQAPNRPDICIGTDSFHTPPPLTARVRRFFADRKFSVDIDSPYSGTIVPQSHYRKNRNVESIMVELNRSLYMDEQTGRRSDRFDEILRATEALIVELCQ